MKGGDQGNLCQARVEKQGERREGMSKQAANISNKTTGSKQGSCQAELLQLKDNKHVEQVTRRGSWNKRCRWVQKTPGRVSREERDSGIFVKTRMLGLRCTVKWQIQTYKPSLLQLLLAKPFKSRRALLPELQIAQGCNKGRKELQECHRVPPAMTSSSTSYACCCTCCTASRNTSWGAGVKERPGTTLCSLFRRNFFPGPQPFKPWNGQKV